MQNIKTDSNRKIIFISIIVNLAMLVALVLLFSPSFETNDDTGLIAIVGGSRGIRDPHMVHSNYLMGLLLVKLFEMMPTIQWTAILQYTVLLFSFVSTTYVLFKRFGSPYMRTMIMLALTWFAYEGYIRIQYTKSAGMIVAMGLIIIFSGLLEDEINIGQIAVGFAITILGSFYRMQQFYCEVAIYAAMVVYLILLNTRKESIDIRKIVKSLILGTALLLVAFGFRAYDRAQYTDAEWAEYLEFDKYRTEVIDYGVPKYEDHEEEYNAIGIDRTAYKLMKNWTFQDSEKFTAATFREIAGFKTKKKINAAFIKSFVKGLARGLLKEGAFICFAVIALGWLLLGKHGKSEIVAVVVLAATITALYMYLYYAGRFMVHRVDVGIWLATSLIMMYLYDPERSDKKTAIFGIAIIILFLIIVPWQSHLTVKAAKGDVKKTEERIAIESVNGDRDHIYLTKVGTLSLSTGYGAFDSIPFGIADNIYPLGGWGAETPVFKSVLQRYGINNPMRDMIDNDKVYLMDNDIETTISYLKKWYNADSRAEAVNTIDGKKVYKIVTN